MRGDDHDEPQGDNRAEVEHGAQHPGAMLVYLEAFDIVVGEGEAEGCDEDEEAGGGLGFDGAAEGAAHDEEGADVGEEDEEDDEVAVDAVEEEGW